MRIFSMRFYKNLVAVYLCTVFCFSYTTLLGSIPNHIYVCEGEKLDFDFHVPVSFSVEKKEIAASSAALSSADAFTEKNADTDYLVTCKLLGIFPIKEVDVSVISAQSVYASGRVIGIYGQTSGVLALKTQEVSDVSGVLVSPAENRVLPGDYICKVNGNDIQNKDELIESVQENGEKRLVLTLERKGEEIQVAVDPVCSQDNKYLLGIWVKDDMAGIGTMTYYTMSGKFGALGHGIGDGETGELLSIADGSIFKMRLLGIQKGETGTPGELEGVIYYGSENYLGTVDENEKMGIYGKLDEQCLQEYYKTDECYEIGYKQDIKTEKAYILSDVSGEVTKYEIDIESLNYQAIDSNKGIRFRVTDQDLIELTGGIVQGM